MFGNTWSCCLLGVTFAYGVPKALTGTEKSKSAALTGNCSRLNKCIPINKALAMAQLSTVVCLESCQRVVPHEFYPAYKGRENEKLKKKGRWLLSFSIKCRLMKYDMRNTSLTSGKDSQIYETTFPVQRTIILRPGQLALSDFSQG